MISCLHEVIPAAAGMNNASAVGNMPRVGAGPLTLPLLELQVHLVFPN